MAYDTDKLKERTPSDYIGQFVKLRKRGAEFVGLSPFSREKTPSFTVVDDKGFWYDFSSGRHGDLIDFAMEYHVVDFKAACEILGGERTASNAKPTPREREPEPKLTPAGIPDTHEGFRAHEPIRAWNPKTSRWTDYRPDHVWPYLDIDGALLGYVTRINLSDGAKLFIPFRYAEIDGEPRWTVAHLDAPRPLYNLPALALPGQVFLLEGEKSADACGRLLGFPSLSWGGSNASAHVDFSPLHGRRVVVWGDADPGGEKAAMQVARRAYDAGAAEIKVIPWDHDKPKGWDAADAESGWGDGDGGESEPWGRNQTLAYLKAHAFIYTPSDDDLPEPEPEAIPTEEIFDANPFSGELPPPRPWAMSKILLYRTVTAIAAPPGTGKSTWAMQLGIAFSQHMKFGEFEPRATGPVWVWNNEDDLDELNRTVLAACQAMGVNPGSLAGRLYLNSGADRQLIVAKETGSGLVATPDVERVIEVIRAQEIRLLIVDPFAETFEVETENSNDVMKRVAQLYRYIAQQTNCCVLLIFHTPKGTNGDKNAGSLDAIRGAGSIGGVVRQAFTMFEMTEADADTYDISPDRRRWYVRLDSAKGNRSEPSSDASWWQRQSIPLDNAANGYPEDHVGVLEWCPFATRTEKAKAVTGDYTAKIAAEIVRVCVKNGYTSEANACALDTLSGALNEQAIGLRNSKIKRTIIGEMDVVSRHEGHIIVISEQHRGTGTIRRVHVENTVK